MRSLKGTKQFTIKKAVKKTAGTTEKQEGPKSALALEMRSVMSDFGLSQEELAELLTGFTEHKITRTGMSGWLRGAKPRISEELLLKALAKIRKAEGKPKNISWEASPEEVSQYIAEKLETMTRKQICLAGELPQATMQQWEAGIVAVERRRFERVKSLIDMWQKIAKEAGVLK